MVNGEAICYFGEAIAFYVYSVSSGHIFSRFEIVIGPGPGPGPELDNCCKVINTRLIMLQNHGRTHNF